MEAPALISAHILSSFRQGSGGWFHRVGNCASVAVIKAAMATYGADAVVMDASPNGPNHAITLRNGATLSLTDQQIAEAADESKFILPDASDGPGDATVLRRAKYLYAVMAVEAIRWHSNDALPFQEAKDFDHALKRLLKGGIDSDKIVLLLGLDAKDVVQGGAAAYVHANWVHAVFATGDRFDNYGESKPIGTFDQLHDPGSNHMSEADKTNFAIGEQIPPAP